jgi:hypothetical protein
MTRKINLLRIGSAKVLTQSVATGLSQESQNQAKYYPIG